MFGLLHKWRGVGSRNKKARDQNEGLGFRKLQGDFDVTLKMSIHTRYQRHALQDVELPV